MFNLFIHAFGFALSVTLPNILLLLLGKILRIKGEISLNFCEQAAHLVFKWGLPTFLFINLVNMKIDYFAEMKLVSAGLISTFILFLISEIYVYFFVPKPEDKGVFVQGVFRSNLGIVGLSFIQNAYGEAGLASGAVYMGLVTILLNILSVITLSRTAKGSVKEKFIYLIKKIASNPLILAIIIALTFNALKIKTPEFIMQTFKYLGAISLPLALLCAGATFHFNFNFNSNLNNSKNSNLNLNLLSDISVLASLGRIILAPIVAVLTGLVFDLKEIPMGILFLMTATPVAAASYPMAKAMGANDVAAANIMGLTTVGAMFSTSIGVAILRGFNLM